MGKGGILSKPGIPGLGNFRFLEIILTKAKPESGLWSFFTGVTSSLWNLAYCGIDLTHNKRQPSKERNSFF